MIKYCGGRRKVIIIIALGAYDSRGCLEQDVIKQILTTPFLNPFDLFLVFLLFLRIVFIYYSV